MSKLLEFVFGRPKSSDPEVFGAFLHERAAFVAQKTIMDYCQVKTGKNEREVFADADFRSALNHCRWEVFAATLVDVHAMAEAWLRPYAAQPGETLVEALVALHERAAAAAPMSDRPPDSAAPDPARIRADLMLRTLAPPRPANTLHLTAEKPLLETLPIHPDQRRDETPAITGALRFHIVSSQQEMERAFDPAGLAPRLVTTG